LPFIFEDQNAPTRTTSVTVFIRKEKRIKIQFCKRKFSLELKYSKLLKIKYTAPRVIDEDELKDRSILSDELG
jgi:hypothetical protein